MHSSVVDRDGVRPSGDPLPLDRPFEAGKPENKLVGFWRMGVPVLTSATPAYVRTMRAAGLDMHCSTSDEWLARLTRYAGDEEARRAAGEAGRTSAEERYGEGRLLAEWDQVLASL